MWMQEDGEESRCYVFQQDFRAHVTSVRLHNVVGELLKLNSAGHFNWLPLQGAVCVLRNTNINDI